MQLAARDTWPHLSLSLGVAAVLGLIVPAPPLHALEPGRPASAYVHRVWRQEEGLPASTVAALAQTTDGYIWLGTQGGLVRFDGVRFTLLGPASGLPDENVWSLAADPDGGLWGAPRDGGIFHRAPDGVSTRYTVADGLPSNHVRCVLRDRAGTLWIGTDDAGLASVSHGRVTSFGPREGLEVKQVRCLLAGSNGSLWIGGAGGVLAERTKGGGQLLTHASRDALLGNAVNCLLEDPPNGLWVGTRGGGVALFRDGRFIQPPAGLQALRRRVIGAMLRGRDGSLWIGSDAGIARWDGTVLEDLGRAQALSTGWVLSLLEDRQGTVWAGAAGGLHQLLETGISGLTTADGLPHELVTCVQEGRAGDLWVGTYAGLARVSPERNVRTYKARDGLPADGVMALREAADGVLWVGGLGGGLARLDGGAFRPVTATDGVAVTSVSCFLEDRDGALWIGAMTGGLTRLQRGRSQVFSTRDGLGGDRVERLAQSRDGGVWVATTGGGLGRYKDGGWTTYGTAQGFRSRSAREVFEDRQGTLWIGTLGDGLVRFKGGRFAGAGVREGLPKSIDAILEDDLGRLWLGSSAGLVSLAKQDLDAVLAGRSQRVRCVQYGTADGMPSPECVAGGSPPAWKTRSGRLLFPTVRGLAIVDPARIPVETVPPPVLIEEAVADGEHFPLTPAVELPARVRRLEIRYTAIDFKAPQKVRFQARLRGMDAGWVDVGERREAFFTKLPHGRYTFEVRACSPDGTWGDQASSWTFRVAPFFYQTPLFFGLCLLAVGGALLGLHHEVVQRERARNAVLAERTRIAQEIHDTMGQTLTGLLLHLVGVGAALPQGAEAAQAGVDRARELARECMQETRRAVAALRPRPLEVGSLVEAVRDMAGNLGAGAGMDVTVVTTGEPRSLPKELEHGLWHVCQDTTVQERNSLKG